MDIALAVLGGRPPRRVFRGTVTRRRNDTTTHRRRFGSSVIVALNRAHLYEHLTRGFAGNGTVRVLFDRRAIARRARSGPYEAERRQADRRLPSKVDALLRAIGWAIVPLG